MNNNRISTRSRTIRTTAFINVDVNELRAIRKNLLAEYRVIKDGISERKLTVERELDELSRLIFEVRKEKLGLRRERVD